MAAVCGSQKSAGMSLHSACVNTRALRTQTHESLASLEEARLVLDVVLLPPLPPGPLQVLDALLLGRRRLQVPLLQTPAGCQRCFLVNKQVPREFGFV